jgi:16S rRNA (guanine966-N2)-methyltransferase
VRVIAGSAKGARLAPVPGGTRPLSDRAREGLFSSLGDLVAGARVLDLFAGTGAVGIEALSRGAEHAVFVDSAMAAVRAVRENLNRTDLERQAGVVRREALRAVQSDLGRFELVFLDPPYALDAGRVEALLAEIAAQGAVVPGGRVVLTRPIKSSMPVIPLNWRPDRHLSYGDSVVLVFTA